MSKKIGIKTWIRILSSPKEAIEEITSIDTRQGIFLLSYILGFAFLFELSIIYRLGKYFPSCSLLLWVVVLSPFIGYLMINLLSYSIHSLSRWINNKTGFLRIRACVMWAKLPLLGVVILDLILLGLLDQALFQEYPTIFTSERCPVCIFTIFGKLAFLLWGLYILYQTLHHIQGCSYKKAIFEIVVSLLVFALIVFVIQMAFYPEYINFFDAPTLTMLLKKG